jgi:hypothetical protein
MSRRLLSLVLAMLAPSVAGAGEISFEEIPAVNANAPPLAEDYAAEGVHFASSDDGSVWTGISGGDPGGWGLEGTNGTAFVGFNGSSYALTARFDAPVRELAVDVARSAGSRAGDSFALQGLRSGALVEEQVVTLGDVNAWTTVALAEEVDEVRWVGRGTGTRRHPFGVDNLRWTAEPDELEVAIDVRPGSPHNRVSPFAQGQVRVALLGAEDFDVSQVDPASLGFGPAGAPAERSRVADVNRDGWPDLVSHHRIPLAGIALGDAEACLVGTTHDGVSLRGCDAVNTVPKHLFAPAAAAAHAKEKKKHAN